jgi:hypothetical protein
MSSIKAKIEFILGISMELDNGVALEFDGAPEAIPELQEQLKFFNFDSNDRGTYYSMS